MDWLNVLHWFDLKFETYFLTENIFSQKTMILVLVTYQEKIRVLFHKEMDTTHFEINSVWFTFNL